MNTLMWTCPACGQSRESEGTDESSHACIQAFKDAHAALHNVVLA